MSPAEAPDRSPIEAAIGRAIRHARTTAGLSMTALAERCGVSQPYLSQLESGKNSPSISTLYRLATALGVSPQDLLPGSDDDVVVIPRDSIAARPIEDRPEAATARVLFGSPDALLQVQRVEADHTQDLGGFFVHDGEELLYVLAGQLAVEVGDRPAVQLGPGDAVWYSSTRPHRWVRVGSEPVNLLVISAAVPGRRPHT